MEKTERFVVFGKVYDDNYDLVEVALVSFNNYPSDDELEKVWNEVKELKKIFYIKVEKQMRFS